MAANTMQATRQYEVTIRVTGNVEERPVISIWFPATGKENKLRSDIWRHVARHTSLKSVPTQEEYVVVLYVDSEPPIPIEVDCTLADYAHRPSSEKLIALFLPRLDMKAVDSSSKGEGFSRLPTGLFDSVLAGFVREEDMDSLTALASTSPRLRSLVARSIDACLTITSCDVLEFALNDINQLALLQSCETLRIRFSTIDLCKLFGDGLATLSAWTAPVQGAHADCHKAPKATLDMRQLSNLSTIQVLLDNNNNTMEHEINRLLQECSWSKRLRRLPNLTLLEVLPTNMDKLTHRHPILRVGESPPGNGTKFDKRG